MRFLLLQLGKKNHILIYHVVSKLVLVPANTLPKFMPYGSLSLSYIYSLKSIVEEEFGEELALERTPQTLTLVGELEEGDDEEDDDDDFIDDDEEDVEILLSFEHEGIEYCLVKLLDPMFLVGKAIAEDDRRVQLLTPEESDEVMPALEEMFLSSQEDTL